MWRILCEEGYGRLLYIGLYYNSGVVLAKLEAGPVLGIFFVIALHATGFEPVGIVARCVVLHAERVQMILPRIV